MLDPSPTEMSESAFENMNWGAAVQRLPLEQQYSLIEDVNGALVANTGTGTPYNPKGLTIYDFNWAHIRNGQTLQLIAESTTTRKTHTADVTLIPKPEGKFQGYMLELDKISGV
jgi:hypothetical protein